MTAAPSPEGPLLTDHLRHWAAHRAQERAVTYVDFPDPGSAGLHHTLGWQALDARARAAAGRIADVAAPGDRAALLLPQGLDYTVAFLGCLYAGVVAVPLFSPELPGHGGRLAAVLADCEPACLLTDAATAPAVRAFVAGRGLPPLPLVRTDVAAPADAPPPSRRPAPDDIAYLQYTSGSTRRPAGVVISHANVVANARQAIAAFDAAAGRSTTVGWLPLFHDMGLLLSVAAPVVGGFPAVLMDPVAFLERPVRWLRLLGAYPGTISAAPNFAYDYCASRIPEGALHERPELRLDRVRVLMNGSEPVRPGTVERFQHAFAEAGLSPEAHCPAYGLAEATVFVTADPHTAAPTTLTCDAEALAEGRVEAREPGGDGVARLVVCGGPAGQEVRIADPATGVGQEAGRVGEIQVRGPNVGRAYWKKAALSAEVFGVRAPGAADDEDGWLRTGDLGALVDGRLVVTGRLKDLIVVDGRNHYPQDIEETVQSALALVRRDHLAAFSVPAPDEGGENGEVPGEEALVVVAEHRRDSEPTHDDARAAARTAKAAVSARHGLRLHQLVLVPPGTLPRTTSGKIARTAGRARHLDGTLPAVGEEA
ncbi:fatty acyl-AMP ligase [Actinomycetota bacterium Odt1-20B]